MGKLKLMTIIGTRPEIIRLAAVIKKCDKYFDQILVHTGQNYDYELNQVFFDDLGLRAPDFYLDAVGGHLGETIGNIIAKSYELMVEQKPDALLILGDTNSCLSAISAKRLHIPSEKLLPVDFAGYGREAEMDCRTLLSYRNEKYLSDITDLANRILEQTGFPLIEKPRKNKWNPFI